MGGMTRSGVQVWNYVAVTNTSFCVIQLLKFIGEHNDFELTIGFILAYAVGMIFFSMDTVEESMNTLEDIVGVVFIFAGLTVLLMIT